MPPFKDWRLPSSHNERFDELSQWVPKNQDCQAFETYQQHLGRSNFHEKEVLYLHAVGSVTA
jgi:hypothetical protein